MRPSKQKLQVKITREGGDTGADYKVQFTDHYGQKVVAFVQYANRFLEIDPENQFLLVDVIASFGKFSHIRAPDGQHCHVSNDLLIREQSLIYEQVMQ